MITCTPLLSTARVDRSGSSQSATVKPETVVRSWKNQTSLGEWSCAFYCFIARLLKYVTDCCSVVCIGVQQVKHILSCSQDYSSKKGWTSLATNVKKRQLFKTRFSLCESNQPREWEMTREEKSSACSGRRNKKTDRSGDAANHSAARAELKRGIREVKSAYRGRTEDCCRCGRGYSTSLTTDSPTWLLLRWSHRRQLHYTHPPAHIVEQHEVRRTLRALNPRKAVGPNSFRCDWCWGSADQLAGVFTKIFNQSLSWVAAPPCPKSSTVVIEKEPHQQPGWLPSCSTHTCHHQVPWETYPDPHPLIVISHTQVWSSPIWLQN